MVFAGVADTYCYIPHAKEQVYSETYILFLDILSGTVIKKPKSSSWETSLLPSDASYKPRKLLDSVEKEVERQTGKDRLAIKVKCLNAFSFSFLMAEIIVTWKFDEVPVGRTSSPKLKM